ncbi:MAG TPA: GNAT family N-acetyltransferase [bacterium]
MIKYAVRGKIDARELDCFFQSWKSPPCLKIGRKLLKGSDLIITARGNGHLVGFLTAVSDKAMIALISLVEVLESHQGKGIGRRLMELAISHYKNFYQIVLITDPDKGRFYEKLGFTEIHGMQIQNFAYGKTIRKQSGKSGK